jgi:hypothetical protein
MALVTTKVKIVKNSGLSILSSFNKDPGLFSSVSDRIR